MSERHIRSTEPIEEQLSKCLSENTRHRDEVHRLKLLLDLRDKELVVAQTKADHFDILMKAVRENEVVRGAWDKFMVALRLAGYDGTR